MRREMKTKDPERTAALAALTLRYQVGDRRAGDALLLGMEGWIKVLVDKHTRPYRGDDALAEDFMQEGRRGALHAAMKWRADGGANVLSYATPWIRVFIKNYITRRVPIVNLTAAERDDVTLTGRPNREQSMNRLQPAFSLDKPLGDDGVTWGDLVEDEKPATDDALAEGLEREATRASVARCLAGLKERDRTIVTERLLSENPPMLEALGQRFGISRERVRQIEAAGLARIERALRAAA